MSRSSRIRFVFVIALTITLSPFLGGVKELSVAIAGGPPGSRDGDEPKKPKKADAKSKTKDKKEPTIKVRWGQRRNESNEDYDARYKKLLKRVKKDKKLDWSGGRFFDEKQELMSLWTFDGRPFICRTDISQEFTADLAMYMETLHREYGDVFKRIGAGPAIIREPVEVIVFNSRVTYVMAGNDPGSLGLFTCFPAIDNDRGKAWPCRHFRLTQFTAGVTNFAKWDKRTLRHEAGHMEFQLRLGFTYNKEYGEFAGFPVISPVWFNEGLASVFEAWDLNKTVDENFAEIPNRGNRAPYVRRMYGTDLWVDFETLWHFNHQTWGASNTYFNYSSAWSLVGYMFAGGKQGHRDFRTVLDLIKRVGENRRRITSNREVVETNAWFDAFPDEERAKMEANWNKWIEENVSKDKRVPDEEYYMRHDGMNPDVVDHLQPFMTEEESKANKKWVEDEEARRKKTKRIEW